MDLFPAVRAVNSCIELILFAAVCNLGEAVKSRILLLAADCGCWLPHACKRLRSWSNERGFEFFFSALTASLFCFLP